MFVKIREICYNYCITLKKKGAIKSKAEFNDCITQCINDITDD